MPNPQKLRGGPGCARILRVTAIKREKTKTMVQRLCVDNSKHSSEHYVELRGRIVELRPAARFIVELDSGQRVPAHVSGRLLHDGVQVGLDDRVTVGLLAYDPSRGRIVSRA